MVVRLFKVISAVFCVLALLLGCNLNDNSVQGKYGSSPSNNMPDSDPDPVPKTLGKVWNFSGADYTGVVTGGLRNIVYQGGSYYVHGTTGVQVSSDGVNWTGYEGETYLFQKDIEYLNGQYVGLTNSFLGWSADGINFTLNNGDIPNLQIRDGGVAYGASRYVWAGRDNSVTDSRIFSSADGLTWVDETIPGSHDVLYDVIYEFSMFVAIGTGTLLTSGDGQTWANTGFADTCTGAMERYVSMASNGTTIVAVGTEFGFVRRCSKTSTNGTAWSNKVVANSTEGGSFNDVCFGNGLFVAVGTNGEIQTWDGGGATAWQEITADGGYIGDFEKVECGASEFVAIGDDGEVQSSSDGITWTKRSLDDGFFEATNGVFYMDAKSYNGEIQILHGNGKIVSSSDGGNNWYSHGYIPSSISNFLSAFELIYEEGKYVAVGHGSMAHSVDYSSWNVVTFGGGFIGFIMGIAYDGASNYVLVGQNGEIQTWDGVSASTSQQTAAGGYSNFFYGVAYGSGLFVAVGTNGEIQTSPDGITWTQRTAGGGYASNFTDIKFINNQFVAVGLNGEVQLSTDGVNWTSSPIITTNKLTDVAHCDGVYAVVANSSKIFVSEDLSDWEAIDVVGDFEGVTCSNDKLIAVGWDQIIAVSE